MQQGLSILGKAIMKLNWLQTEFSANFHLTHVFFVWGSLNFPIREHEGGVFHRRNWSQKFCFYKCYDICFCNFCEKNLTWKNRFISLKRIFSKYLTSSFGCWRPSSSGPFFICLEYLHAKKWWTRLNFPSGIFGSGEHKRQRYEIFNDVAPIALVA